MNNEQQPTNLIPTNPDLRMTSLEVADLTEKQHAHIMRDIRDLIEQEAIGQSNFGLSSYTNSQNKEQPMYSLDFESTMVLITGYDAKRRSLVIKRWLALERGEAAPAMAGSFNMNPQMSELMSMMANIILRQDRMETNAMQQQRPARFIDVSNVQAYVENMCHLKQGVFTTKDSLYNDYCAYCEQSSTHKDSKPNFFVKLYRAFSQVSQGRVLINGVRTAIVTGLYLGA